ncbi:MAG TPA: pilus assembly protein PilM, partial [bacterium]|nr:pilus assembly protein PilM [bacterium]
RIEILIRFQGYLPPEINNREWFMRLRGRKSMVGIDLGTYSLKAVEVESREDGFYLNRATSIFYPEKVLEGGEFQNVPLFTQLIDKLWREGDFDTRNVSISWKMENGFFRVLTLPLLLDKELFEAAKLEIGSRYDVDTNLISFDYVILDKDEKNQEIKVLAAGIPRVTASTVYDVLKEIDLNLNVLEPEFICQLNVLPPVEESFMLLNVGAYATILYMGMMDTINVIRTLRFGGNTATDVISSTLNISFEEAEIWKKDRFPEEVGYAKTSVGNALLDTFSVFLREVNRSIDYFYQVTNSYPARIILDGGGSLLLGLADYISRGLSLPVEMLDMGKVVKKNVDLENLNFYSVAIGAALSGLDYKCPYKFFERLELGRIVV